MRHQLYAIVTAASMISNEFPMPICFLCVLLHYKMILNRVFVVISLIGSGFALPTFPGLERRQHVELLDWIKRNGLEPRQFPTFGVKKIPDDDHPFIAPSATAQRGPCPGLNLLANHGYLNREGITTFSEMLYGLQEGVGWALDLSLLTTAIAVVNDGNWWTGAVSIGGPDVRAGSFLFGSSPISGGLLNHNAYEIDSSLTRNDIYFGDNKNLNGSLYQQIWDVADQMNGGVIDAKVMAAVRSNRYEASTHDNPQFTFPPIGAFFFAADHLLWNTLVSSDPFTGELGPSTRETLSMVYGAQKSGERNWTYVPERFPDQWYRRSRPLTIVELITDALPTIVNADLRAQLPIGITPASFASSDAFLCAIKEVVFGAIPASLKSIDAFSALLISVGSIFPGC